MNERRKRKGIMLARPYERRRLTEPKFGWASAPFITCQPKLDGERCVACADSVTKEVVLLSSTALPFPYFHHIKDALREFFDVYPDVKLDGELYIHGQPFEVISSIAGRTTNQHPDEELLEYHIFDVAHPDNLLQSNRLLKLTTWYGDFFYKHSFLKAVQSRAIDNDYRVVENEIASAVANGYEGIILRHPLKQYEEKRSSWIMKFKPRKVDIYVITNCIEAIDKDGYEKGMLGAFVVNSGDCGTFEVGAGTLSHKGREWVWHNQSEVVGKMLVLAYNSTHESGIPRHAVALSIHGIPDDILH